MADTPSFDPSQPFETVDTPQFDPSKPFEDATDQSQLTAAVTDIPHEIYSAGKSALTKIGEQLNPFSEARHAAYARAAAAPSLLGTMGEVGNQTLDTLYGVDAVPELAMSPATGASRSLIGHPYSALTGIPYEEAKRDVDTAMGALAPGRGGLRAPVPLPARPQEGPLGVTFSEGQRTGDLPTIRREQAALRGQLGPQAESVASDFAEQQAGQVASARQRVAEGFDPFGQQLAETPADAGAVLSQAIQNEARNRRAGVTAAYNTARDMPGEIHAGALEGIGQRIKGDLTLGPDPVIIDDELTHWASKAIQDVDNRIANLTIQNRADPFGAPNQENITGVSLNGIDQMRKRLSMFRQKAFDSGDATDLRAARAILNAFDNHIDNAVNSGLFSGDPLAVQAWNDARAAHADFRATFGGGGAKDPVGRVVQKIIGNNTVPAAIPNDVADFLYGSSGVNPSTLNVGVANRVRNILGAQSPEWSAVKQGLFSRLVDPGVGVTAWGPARIAQRMNRFLNNDGRELANAVFSPQERDTLQQFADLHRAMEVPPTGANRSETSTFMAPMMRRLSGTIGTVIGAAIGRTVVPIPLAGEAIGAGAARGVGRIGDIMQARTIRRQMPLVINSMRQYQRALARAQRANAPLSQAALSAAALNLSRALGPMGINLGMLQSPGISRADQNQQNVPGPPGQ